MIITDALEMAAIQEHYTLDEAIIRAINDGNDILLFSRNIAASPNSKTNDVMWDTNPESVIKIIESAVISGAISETRIEQSFARIQSFKETVDE